ncbi:MAG: DUF2155 domain-containing protein [Parvibaculum sp.]|uniref:DUF2155 domain-containing protein n=1 Tax=Parvibaculum sp. TaxID=2024848 RepID=UPI002ABCF63D|nr:DUF2155 domain-containing protein [Parvibaculum sp.]MDZ4381554.1 DUF2155 domain-containing protein [Parvibaculum sp.]
MRFLIPPVVGAALLAMGAGPAAAGKYPVAVFSGLDKITARVTSFEAKVNEPATFGALQVLVRTCDKNPPEETPRTAAYVEIRQLERTGATAADPAAPSEVHPAPVFSGWMFAESPGLNALEHPVYDVWVTDCKTSSGDASSGSE